MERELAMADDTLPQAGALSYSIDTAAAVTGLSRTRLFEAIRDAKLTARKDGRSTIVERSELARYLATLPTRGRPPESIAA